VYPYRGFFVHHQGREEAVMEANQGLFLNADDGYRVSHPVAGGDDCLTLVPDASILREIAPRNLLRSESPPVFRHQRLRIDARAQALVALFRYSLLHKIAEPLEAESLEWKTVPQQSAIARKKDLVNRPGHCLGETCGRRKAEVGLEPRGIDATPPRVDTSFVGRLKRFTETWHEQLRARLWPLVEQDFGGLVPSVHRQAESTPVNRQERAAAEECQCF
jgi:hypothetical protein